MSSPEGEPPSNLPALPVGLPRVPHQELHAGLAVAERVVLPQVAQAELFAADHLPRVEFLVAQKDAAERALARPVSADQADLLVVRECAAGPR